jgi:hypothetical protein
MSDIEVITGKWLEAANKRRKTWWRKKTRGIQ